MPGMIAEKRSRGKPRQRWEKDITDTFGTMAAASRVAKNRHQFRKETSEERRPGEDMLRKRRMLFPCHLYQFQQGESLYVACNSALIRNLAQWKVTSRGVSSRRITGKV